MANSYLSKSLFMLGLQCPKALYLEKYRPELKTGPTESQERLFSLGADVHLIARELFPGGTEIPHEGLTFRQKIAETASMIQNRAETVYEATFSHDGVLVKADIIRRMPEGWELFEVKSSTDLKDIHLDDIAIQYYVLSGSGVPVYRASIVHIDNQYERNGALDPGKLFVRRDVTALVRDRQPDVSRQLQEMRQMLGDRVPDIDIGEQCGNPYECGFREHCWGHVPEYSVFDLGGSRSTMFELYRQGMVRLEDIPPDALPAKQRFVRDAYIARSELFDRDQVGEFLDSLWYPLYFLDFETFSLPVPPFDGTRPYQHIPYQYSLHCLASRESELEHAEFLALPGVDPRRELAEHLVSCIPRGACILAYNAPYEARILKELCDWLPGKRAEISRIVENLRDLAVPFRQRLVYRWEMMGSYSQKAVLPSLVPTMSYDDLEVRNGEMATDAYFRMCACHDEQEMAAIRQALLRYCRTDTLGMVELVNKLRERV